MGKLYTVTITHAVIYLICGTFIIGSSIVFGIDLIERIMSPFLVGLGVYYTIGGFILWAQMT